MKTTSLTEDDTIKRLKGLTNKDALDLFCNTYDSVAAEWFGGTNTGMVPINILRDKVDKELNPYGWSFDILLKLNAFEGNIS